ncbi:hypothetical protein IMG5_098310 [Ichthyophthirius multifiliis]|uniref:Uncharacterized protein n=1 Tax=Ichthyophthirius multifiliis TaxID=5932 RepID=G0QRX5_ICHMU|nr:hypothetical protein IMG5_098310 [Ichthyophthirius multifiliis]EGR32005.1 hypothetical protein IMG5_098310 [Ichthyophthirius multifiliis]|eukprot:XP_004035491.1 hypothetical protein IMG5_098310 [Ichthyophthirius multifiliis]
MLLTKIRDLFQEKLFTLTFLIYIVLFFIYSIQANPFFSISIYKFVYLVSINYYFNNWHSQSLIQSLYNYI